MNIPGPPGGDGDTAHALDARHADDLRARVRPDEHRPDRDQDDPG